MRPSREHSARLSRAIDVLRSGLTRDPAALRTYAIRLVAELAEGDGGAWYELGMVDGEPLPVRYGLEGLADVAVARQLEERIPYPQGDPRLPDPRWNRRFVLLRGLIPDPDRDLFPSRLYDRCWRPARLADQLRMSVHHDGEFVAWIGAGRLSDRGLFRRADARRVAAIAEPLADALISARAVERAVEPESSADFLVAADGTIELASEESVACLDDVRTRSAIEAWVRAIDRGEPAPCAVIAGCAPRWTRLTGASGSRYLVHLDRITPVRVHPGYVLSKTQRAVARLAIAGATVGEIATTMCLQPTTVRTHLRIAYDALSVSTRTELAAELANMPSESASTAA